MQKRARSARARRAVPRFLVLPALSLALVATAVGMTGAPGLRCSGAAMTSVRTTLAQLGPQGTTAENSTGRTGWVNQQDPKTMVARGSKLLRKVRAKRNLEAAWRIIQENARTSKSAEVRGDIEKFAADVTANIERLYRSLQRETFVFPPAKGIAIPKGGGKPGSAGIRPIVLAKTESRIVQRAILNVLTDLPQLECYLNSPFSFGGMRKSDRRALSAVPAAVSAVLAAIGNGAGYVMCADISGFFTKIPKPVVSSIIAKAAPDAQFMRFFDQAIHVELTNMAALRQHVDKFPIEDIGVAQGNSLSPLLGNILLHEFDNEMNAGDCCCIRYIDDFIILAPTAKAALARIRVARRLLERYKMELSAAKSSQAPIAVEDGFEFLGIEFANGLLRPAGKAQSRLLASVEQEFARSAKAFDGCHSEQAINKSLTLVATLKRVDGIMRGWGKHYRFCNDEALFSRLDDRVDQLIRGYLGRYSAARDRVPAQYRRALLGIEELGSIERQPFLWPKKQRAGQLAQAQAA